MLTVTVREARQRISRILDRVTAGEEVLILRRGEVVPRVVRPASEDVRFRERGARRDELSPMGEPAADVVRQGRED